MKYLEVHPATQAWWDRREQCESCRHLNLREGQSGESVMRCYAALTFRRPSREPLGVYCIDSRDEDGPCGPEARLYEAKE